jgi:ubiquinone/menaquinone biosynthesis C-methylase UbiE
MTTDTATRDRWRREVEREFSDPRAVSGWRAWHDTWSEATRLLTDRLLAAAHLAPGQHVLDIACGTGEPALTIARVVGPTGSVVACDPAVGLLATAAERATEAGLTNVLIRQADAAALPYADESFDRVTCRLGLMYFLDPVQALAEMRRVLAPDGRAAVLVWGDPMRASHAAAFFGPILARMALPTPEAGAPQPYRFAEPGTLPAAMEAAGFLTVEEDIATEHMAWPGRAEDFVRWFREVAIPMDFIWEHLGPAESERTETEIVANMRPFERDGAVQMDIEVVVGTGIR